MDNENTENTDLIQRQAQHQADLIESYKKFFDTEDGKVVLYDLMKKGYFLSSTLGPTPIETHRNEGMREIVVYILEILEKNPEDLREFIKEGSDTEQEYYL